MTTVSDPADNCPICGETYVCRCRCPLGDRICPHGHEWHVCQEHGAVVIGKADHASLQDTFRCTCPIDAFGVTKRLLLADFE
jgi:hypothetical protein